jgi:hypothetical protein
MIRNRIPFRGCWLALTAVSIAANSADGRDAETYRYYHVDAAVISLAADHSLASYRGHGGGSGTPGATLGYSTPNSDISIELLVENSQFFADVETRDSKQSGEGTPKTQRVDLTELRPTSVDLGADKDGRAYQLNLVPSVKSVRTSPKPFREVADDLYRLQFHSSRIILNDKKYVGRMLASDAEKFSIEICGVANIEFSLHHLKESQPWGRLERGQITISNPDGTTIEIQNVTNGPDNRLIEGGPCTVWVRWNKPQSSVEEYQAMLKTQREELKKAAAEAGAGSTAADALATIENELEREPGPWVVACGACGITKSEIVKDE